MIVKRESFIFYRSFFEGINALPERMRLPLYTAVSAYALDQQEPDFGKGEDACIQRAIWSGIRPQLEANIKRYLNGLHGGPPKGSRNNPDGRRIKRTNQELTENKPNDNVNDNDNDNVNVNEKGVRDTASTSADAPIATKKRLSFVVPSVEEISNYAAERGDDPGQVDAFFDHYTANGWRQKSGLSIKDWRAAWRGWMRREANFKANRTIATQSSSKASDRIHISSANLDDFKTNLF